MFGELFEGLDGFEKGSLIYSHLQDACDMCHGVYCPWRETEGSKHPTRPGRGGRVVFLLLWGPEFIPRVCVEEGD